MAPNPPNESPSKLTKPPAGALSRARRILGRFFASRGLHLFPVWGDLRHYSRQSFTADLRAGCNVAMIAFPQGIAYAIVAGLPAVHGLLSAALATMVSALFSGTRLVAIGPGNSTCVIIFSGLMAAGFTTEQERIMVLPLFMFLVGCFQIIGALAKMSLILNYVSRSVVTAYVSAAACLIIVNQVQNLLGFSLTDGSTFVSILLKTLGSLDQTRTPEMLLGCVALLTMLTLPRMVPGIPNAAATLVLMGLLALGFQALGADLRFIAGFTLADLNFLALRIDPEMVARLAAPAFAVAFVGVLEGASIGRSLASRCGERLNVNQMMFGMGIANLTNCAVSGVDASGSVTRSVLNWSSGARTPVSMFFCGATCLILLLTIGFLMAYIPRSALAAVVIVVAFSLFNRTQIYMSVHSTRSDAAVFFITLISAFVFTLDTAIYIGVFTSVILFLHKAGVPELVEYAINDEGQLAEMESPERRLPGISILHAEGDLFFGSTELFVEQARQAMADPNLRVVILRLKRARNLDATCAMAIMELHQILQANGGHLIISDGRKETYRVFRDSGLLEVIGRDNFFMENRGNPVYSTRNALKRAQELLGQSKAEIRIFVDRRKQEEKQEASGKVSASQSD